MYWERFAVFDVETPNSANNRMSAIGVTIVSQGQIVQHLETLIDPETHFDPFNVQLTGITPQAVQGKPTFPVLWDLLEPMLNNSILVAHNAPFDLSVLARCLKHYGIRWQDNPRYLCTCQVGRKHLRHLPDRKLNTICSHLQIPLDHHRAGSDSEACAKILIHYLQQGIDLTPFLRTYDMTTIRTKPHC